MPISSSFIAQLIGFAAVVISVSIFQINKRGTMLKLSTVAAVLYTVHFYLLGAFAESAMNLIACARNYVYFRTEPNKRHRWVLVSFRFLIIAGTVVTWQGPLSLLPLLGTMSSSIAFWQKNTKYIRRWGLIASPLWFAYNAISHSYPGMLIEVIMLTSNLVGEYRFDFNHKSHVQRRLARPT